MTAFYVDHMYACMYVCMYVCMMCVCTNVTTSMFLIQVNRDIYEMEAKMTALQESAGLFEVNVPDYKQLKSCRREVVMLKSLWDMIMLVKSSFSDWNTTLWCDINVEQMEMDCKKFVKVQNTKHGIACVMIEYT